LVFVTLVTPGQINFQVPTVAVGAGVPVRVRTNCGGSNEVASAPQTVAVQAATPEFLYWVKNLDGRNPVVAVDALTGNYLGAAGLIPGVAFAPAKRGDYLVIYGSPSATPIRRCHQDFPQAD
jgi:uncharacterized protein (TIGR03437 family)